MSKVDRTVQHSTLEGVLAALVTPMTADEEIDCPALARLVDDLIGRGVHGLIPLGSTGEYYALSRDERTRVAATTIEAAAGRVPVVVGANAGSTREVIGYCQEAQRLGAAAVMLAAPYYSLPRPEELFRHFEAVSGAIDIPIVLYNYPGRTGVDMTPDLIARLAELDRVEYVKESTGDAARAGAIVTRAGGRIRLLCGCDTLALESFVMGAVGWVGGVANVLPAAHVELFELAVRRRDFAAAREVYLRLLPILSLIEGGGKYTQWVKAACGLVGRPSGPPRRPLLPATPDEVARLAAAIDALPLAWKEGR